MAVLYDASAQPGSNDESSTGHEHETIEGFPRDAGRWLIVAALEPKHQAAFEVLAEALDDFDTALFRVAHTTALAAEVFDLDAAELVDVLLVRTIRARLLADLAELQALPTAGGVS